LPYFCPCNFHFEGFAYFPFPHVLRSDETNVFHLDASSVEFIQNTLLAPFFGRPLNPQAAAEGEKVLSSSLSKIEALWLKESGQFLLGSSQPSIADLCLVCEIMQLEVCSYEH
jgi:glutathione S-transferase